MKRSKYKKSLFVIALLILAVALGLIFFKPLSALFVKQAIRERMASLDFGLDDGLHAVLCGTGTPLPDRERVGPCTAVIAGKRLYIVDAGEGSARNILLAGLPAGKIEAILLTHFHSDHIASLGNIMMQRWVNGSNAKPMEVIGPAGVETVVAGFNLAYALDSGYRTAHHGAAIFPPSGAGGIARPFKLGAAEDASAVVLDQDGLKITAFKVDHRPVAPAVGYRFDYRGRSLVVSGDTIPCASLIRHSRNADLLLHEAMQASTVKMIEDVYRASSNAALAKIMSDVPQYHTSVESAARIAAQARVKHLMLYHILPALPSSFVMHRVFLGDAKKYFSGPITIGADGMLITLPAESDEIKIK
ncbi:MAG: MBL fold metallo-hydrolase [Deltaproteobacteria bacterium]|nr:MBL fold metallo-hydrolase [Deltaproteobacteria bacterium]